MTKADLVSKFPQFFKRNGAIAPHVDRKTREVLAQLLLEPQGFELISYATAFCTVKCKSCGFTQCTTNLEDTTCDRRPEFIPPKHTDHKHENIFYIWKVAGLDTYKLGITSKYLGTKRIDDIARRQGVSPQVICYIDHPHAREIERLAKQLFKKHRTKLFTSGDGYSEMYDFDDIKKVLRQIDEIQRTFPDSP